MRWGVVLALLVAALPASAKPRLAFLGLRGGAGVPQASVDGVAEYVETELAGLGAYEVIGLRDLASLIGFEQKKQLLGCADDACVAELSGALGVDRVLTGSVAAVGSSTIVSLTLLDVARAKVVARVGQRVRGGRSLDPVLDAVRPLLVQLLEADGLAPRPKAAPLEVVALLRGEAVVNEGGGAAAAGVAVQGALFGGEAMLVGPVKGAAVPVALRLDLRVSPLPGALVRPYLAAGATIFSDGPALRLAAGAELALPSFRLYAELAYEHLLASELGDPVILALGAGYPF